MPEIKIKMDELGLAYHKKNYMARVRTTRGDHLQLRDVPGVNKKVLHKMKTGDWVKILNDEPEYNDGYLWWYVSVKEEGLTIEGWCVEAFKENDNWHYCLLATGVNAEDRGK